MIFKKTFIATILCFCFVLFIGPNTLASRSKSSSSSQSAKNNEKSELLPKTKNDDSDEIDPEEFKLVIDQNTPKDKDFDFVQNSTPENSGNVEWMKNLGIIFLFVACLGFFYTLLGLITQRSKYTSKK